MAYPIFLSLVAQNVVNITDTAFLGRLGEVELGASAIAGVFYIMLFLLGIGFSQGLQIFIGRRNGEQNHFLIGRLMSNSATIMLVLSVVFFSIVVSIIEPALKMVLQSEQVADASIRFMSIRIFGLFFVFQNILIRAFFIGIERTKVLVPNAILMAATNVVLDYAFIFGNFGMPVMGIEGAALASVLSEMVASLYLMTYLYRMKDREKYGIRFRLAFDWEQVKQLFSVSIFIMFQVFLAICPWMFFFIAIEQLGERPLAISNIIRSLYTFYFIPIDSLAMASASIVTNTIGQGMKSRVLFNVNRIVRLGLIAVVPFMIITFIVPTHVLSVYTNNTSLVTDSIVPLFTVALCLPFGVLARIYFSALQGTGDTKTTLWIELFVIILYTIYIFVVIILLKSPVWVCWTSEHVYWILTGVMSYYFLRRGGWKTKQI